MNKILDYIIDERKGHYCHCIEVSSAYEIESTIESLVDQLGEEFTEAEFIEFFESMDFIYWPEDGETEVKSDEDEVHSFDVKGYLAGTL